MKKYLKKVKWDAILTSVLYIVLGIVSMVIPLAMAKILGYLIGILLIVAGAVSMICYLLREAAQNYYRNDFLHGLVGITVGILVLYKVEWIISLLPVLLGILVLASGCGKLQEVIDMKRMNYGSWVGMLILAALNVGFGVVLIVNPFEWALVLFQVIGAGLIFSGVTDLAMVLFVASRFRKVYEAAQPVDSTFVEVTGEESGRVKDTADSSASGSRKPGTWKSLRKEPGAESQGSANGSRDAGAWSDPEKNAAGGQETECSQEADSEPGTAAGVQTGDVEEMLSTDKGAEQ